MENTVNEISSEYVASSQTRRRIVVSGLFFTWVIIIWLIYKGSPTNSLHESALAWAFGTNIVLTLAYSFGTLVKDYFKK